MLFRSSSTGHLIVVSAWIDYPEAKRETFEIFIQLGAIFAVLWHYRRDLSELLFAAPREAGARARIGKILLAFVPAAGAGFLLHNLIEEFLFSPTFVATTLILGGVLLIALERRPWTFHVERIESVTWGQALGIGLAQVVSLLPGVSRAAATIVGGFQSSALGSPYTYPSDNNTQANVSSLVAAGNGGSIWCGNASNVWAFTPHTEAQATQVQKDMSAFIQAQQTRYAGLVAQINAATTPAEVEAINW